MIWLVEIFVVEVMFLMWEKNIDFSYILSGTKPLVGTKIILIVNQDKNLFLLPDIPFLILDLNLPLLSS